MAVSALLADDTVHIWLQSIGHEIELAKSPQCGVQEGGVSRSVVHCAEEAGPASARV
jgi:hypothetical protein